MKIKEVTLSKFNHVTVDKKPRGLFLAPSASGGWWACDNRNNQAYEMKFPTREAAERWLMLCEGGDVRSGEY
ncbi:hypothetical protein FDZ71_00410 [bacterium]|nr:MAG: hypothetical protein FDZ71_00410 [bacterium]